MASSRERVCPAVAASGGRLSDEPCAAGGAGQLHARSGAEEACGVYEELREGFARALAATARADANARAALLGGAVRLAFHDVGEYDASAPPGERLGADGCLSRAVVHNGRSDNEGLLHAGSAVAAALEPLWRRHCALVGRADAWALFAREALVAADPTGMLDARLGWSYGRVDAGAAGCEAGAGRLPSAHADLEVLRTYFEDQLGLTLAQGVALFGAHTLGHARPSCSGVGFASESSWTPRPAVLDNAYFIELVDKRWARRDAPGGTGSNWQRGPTTRLMLDADMTLAYDVHSSANARAHQCGERGQCEPFPQTRAIVDRYADNNTAWLEDFADAFEALVSVGYGSDELVRLDVGACSQHLQVEGTGGATMEVQTSSGDSAQLHQQGAGADGAAVSAQTTSGGSAQLVAGLAGGGAALAAALAAALGVSWWRRRRGNARGRSDAVKQVSQAPAAPAISISTA